MLLTARKPDEEDSVKRAFSVKCFETYSTCYHHLQVEVEKGERNRSVTYTV